MAGSRLELVSNWFQGLKPEVVSSLSNIVGAHGKRAFGGALQRRGWLTGLHDRLHRGQMGQQQQKRRQQQQQQPPPQQQQEQQLYSGINEQQ